MKSKNDYFLLMDKFRKAGELPNGKSISRHRSAQYFASSNISFESYYGRKMGEGGLEKWYKEWFSGRVKGKGMITEKRQVDPSINISSEDFDFPEGETEGLQPYEWKQKESKILYLSDLHIPYHNLEAVKTAIKYGRDAGVNGIILNGDILDMYEVSQHDKTPNKTRIVKELELGRMFLEQLRKLFPSEKIVFKEGNHETRLKRFLEKNAPQISELEAIQLKELLKLKDFNIDHVSNNQLIRIGKLNVIHGNEFNTGGGGINVARNLRLKALDNILFGNFHKTQEDVQRNVNGDVYGSWSVACLCDLSPKYMPFNQWNLGFAVIEVFKDGNFKVDNKKIINGNVL